MTPIELLNTWIEEEKSAGAQHAQHAVLSSQGLNGASHGRIVAIREITKDGVLFFTQKRTRKVLEIKNNNQVTLTFWFERYVREVIMEGEASLLSDEQNEHYWQTYPQWAQIRFCSYAPTSGEPIESKQLLEDKRRDLAQHSKDTAFPCPPDYCGIAIKPKRFVFYSYRLDELSDVWEYLIDNNTTIQRRLSP
ncbi:pyridoxamine 5'-phosphate oxidase family protein [Legionella pneumophila serogroup 1]|uniref:Pyridoxamine 5'-phosphate oxidase n=1 Tax=Legionella pneumophila TaxID=446 RepID=A0AAN5Q2H2_LEGPN|nr:pyridoxamine 5'-phosphate oxidase family protein [Legionella pneumophila]AMV14875.1 Pyridoxine/pyridoxamine 5'-phosphate oxidase [Legionella pneumophila]ANN93057.1 pyridoxamine 5'-phosphate oxidase [Legionella pneumophila]MCH9061567.1 pyridoxamine 5'-phosphate oxidase [Legionella pneumophila serogroup 1]MCH9064357.1 pyridoxamine 5'-phosphate oxidase [Legionella pneumophila serogroup 1]MCH9066769.1 pyridoxamine 5'-phosphate oxidase [Legionella pneumophila serogroup 1]